MFIVFVTIKTKVEKICKNTDNDSPHLQFLKILRNLLKVRNSLKLENSLKLKEFLEIEKNSLKFLRNSFNFKEFSDFKESFKS